MSAFSKSLAVYYFSNSKEKHTNSNVNIYIVFQYGIHGDFLLRRCLNVIAVATTEADEAIALSVFVQIMGIPPQKAAGLGHFDHFWSLRLV